jgi:hypothetical protein
MSTDLALFLGVIIGVLAVPGILSAILDGSAPRAAAIAVIVSGALIVYAVYNKPGGYAISDLPEVFTTVVAQFTR